MPRIAYLTLTASPPAPPANRKVLGALQEEYPDHEVEEILILDELKRHPATIGTSIAAALGTYGADIIRGRKAFKYSVFRTSHIFRRIRQILRERIDPTDLTFTFQMQSLFDGSIPGMPHFIYTDHTHLENLHYEGVDRSQLYAQSWIDCEHEVYRASDHIFTRSANVTRSVTQEYGIAPSLVSCVYAGSNTETLESAPRPVESYAGKHILFVGVDWERKGGPVLLEAFRKVLAVHPDAKLTIVGCNPEVGDLPNCHVAGRVPLEAVGRFYDEATVFCLPTRLEPFGIVFVEAMWHRLPVVATWVGAVPDMIDEGTNGHMVQPDDVGQLTTRLVDLLADPDCCARMGTAAYMKARDRYHWPSVARKMREKINQVIEARDASKLTGEAG